MKQLDGLSPMRSRRLLCRPLDSQRHDGWNITINAGNLRVLFLARHVLAGFVLGAAILLTVLLFMD